MKPLHFTVLFETKEGIKLKSRVIHLAGALAERIFGEITSGWPADRDVFSAKPREILILIRGGASILKFNYDNGDDTFSHEVRFKDKTFVACSKEKLDAA